MAYFRDPTDQQIQKHYNLSTQQFGKGQGAQSWRNKYKGDPAFASQHKQQRRADMGIDQASYDARRAKPTTPPANPNQQVVSNQPPPGGGGSQPQPQPTGTQGSGGFDRFLKFAGGFGDDFVDKSRLSTAQGALAGMGQTERSKWLDETMALDRQGQGRAMATLGGWTPGETPEGAPEGLQGFQQAFGATKGRWNYNPEQDLNNDGVIDFSDWTQFAAANQPPPPPPGGGSQPPPGGGSQPPPPGGGGSQPPPGGGGGSQPPPGGGGSQPPTTVTTQNTSQVNPTTTGQPQNPFIKEFAGLNQQQADLAGQVTSLQDSLKRLQQPQQDVGINDLTQGFQNTLAQINAPFLDQMADQRIAQNTFMNDFQARQQAREGQLGQEAQAERARNAGLNTQLEQLLQRRMGQFDAQGKPINDATTVANLAGIDTRQKTATDALTQRMKSLGVLRGSGAPIDRYGELSGQFAQARLNEESAGQQRQERAFGDALDLLQDRRNTRITDADIQNQALSRGIKEMGLGLEGTGQLNTLIGQGRDASLRGLQGIGGMLGSIGGQDTMANRFGTADRTGMLDGASTLAGQAGQRAERFGTADRTGMIDGASTLAGQRQGDVSRWGDADRLGYLGGQRTMMGQGRDDRMVNLGRDRQLSRDLATQRDVTQQRGQDINQANFRGAQLGRFDGQDTIDRSKMLSDQAAGIAGGGLDLATRLNLIGGPQGNNYGGGQQQGGGEPWLNRGVRAAGNWLSDRFGGGGGDSSLPLQALNYIPQNFVPPFAGQSASYASDYLGNPNLFSMGGGGGPPSFGLGSSGAGSLGSAASGSGLSSAANVASTPSRWGAQGAGLGNIGPAYSMYKGGQAVQDLLGDRFRGSIGMGNIASGAGTGAAIGSIVPGVGTVVGAGIGAADAAIGNIPYIGKYIRPTAGLRAIGSGIQSLVGGGGPDYGSMDQNNLTRMLGRGNAPEGQAAYDELVRRGINPDDAYRRLSLASRNFQYTDPGMAGQETA